MSLVINVSGRFRMIKKVDLYETRWIWIALQFSIQNNSKIVTKGYENNEYIIF